MVVRLVNLKVDWMVWKRAVWMAVQMEPLMVVQLVPKKVGL